MPNTREKLIELIRMPVTIFPDAVISPHITFTLPYAEDLADHLIANGVTFAADNNVGSKWIPVTERLPEKSDYYLAVTDKHIIQVLPYSAQYKVFNAFDFGGTNCSMPVSHWMPLPEAPKGE